MQWFQRLRGFVFRRRVATELRAELEHHVELLTRDLERSGLQPAAARRAAEVRVGDPVRAHEQTADVWGWSVVDGWRQDVRYAWRGLLRAPGFSALIVAVLALGIGATTAVYSVVDAVLLRPLSYRAPDELYDVGAMTAVQAQLSYPDALDMAGALRGVELTLARRTLVPLRADAGVELIAGAYVLDNFFEFFGTAPVVGRLPRLGEGEEAAALVVGESFAEQRLGGRAAALGRNVELAGRSYTVTGVMPRGFDAMGAADVWLPAAHLAPQLRDAQRRGAGYTGNSVYARIAGDAAAGRAELERAAAVVAGEHGSGAQAWTVRLQPLRAVVQGGADRPLLLVLLAVALVLAIVCANVAGLMLVRAVSRQRELAVRAALGAGRWRVARQLLAEAGLLSLVGASAGAVLAALGVDAVRAGAPGLLPRLQEVAVDARVLVVTAALAALATLIVGCAPLFVSLRRQLTSALAAGVRSGGSPSAARARTLLVVLECALAVVLLAGAGLLLRSLQRVQSAGSLGFDADHVIAVPLTFPPSATLTPEEAQARAGRVRDALSALDGIDVVGQTDHLPYRGMNIRPIAVRGRGGDQAVVRVVDAAYFRAMGLKLDAGRAFVDGDAAAPPRAVVNRRVANTFFVGGRAVGERILVTLAPTAAHPAGQEVEAQIVGVIQDVRAMRPDVEAPPEIYLTAGALPPTTRAALVARSERPQRQLNAVRTVLATLEPDMPVTTVGAMADFVDELVSRRRFAGVLITTFAVIALALAALGVYGITAHSVAQRMREFGIRCAVGAMPRDVLLLVLREGVRLALAAAVIGLVCALALAGLLQAHLFEVTARDPFVLGAATLLLPALALVAALGPALRALRIDVATVLRTD